MKNKRHRADFTRSETGGLYNSGFRGRLAQRQSAAFTRRRSLVQSQQRPPPAKPRSPFIAKIIRVRIFQSFAQDRRFSRAGSAACDADALRAVFVAARRRGDAAARGFRLRFAYRAKNRRHHGAAHLRRGGRFGGSGIFRRHGAHRRVGRLRVGAAVAANLRRVEAFVFVRVAQRAIRSLSLATFRHLHSLSMRFHLDRQTGRLSRVIERGGKSIEIF